MKINTKTNSIEYMVPGVLSLLRALTDTLPVLILYLFTVLWYTVLNRAETYEIFQSEFFWSFRKFLAGDLRLGIEIAGNVIMFMPFGFLLCDLFYKNIPLKITHPSAYSSSSSTSNVQAKRKNGDSKLNHYGKWLLIPLLALSFSLLIETLQLTLVRGLAEVDDLFTNTFGAILGLCSYEVLRKLSGTRTFKAVLAIIRATFVLICLIILIFNRKLYSFKENNLTRSFCFQVDEASTQGNELTLRGFAFGYNHRPVPPGLVLRPTKAGNKIDMNVTLRPTKTGNEADMNVTLRQAETEDTIVLNVNYGAARPDVNEYFLCDYDYTNVGFTATGIVNPETEYEILIGWPLSKLVSTGVFIIGEDVHRVAYEDTYNEELLTASNEEEQIGTFEDVGLSDTDTKEGLNRNAKKERPGKPEEESHFGTSDKGRLNVTHENEHFSNTEEEPYTETTDKQRPSDTNEDEILIGTTQEENLAGTGRFELPDLPTDYVKNGTLLVCRPDMHIWVFQYDGYLYWIADEGFHFEDDGMTYIQYHLWTTQLQNLPSDRLKKKYLWDNIGGYFEKHELSGDFGKYRVMCCELPTEYSITSILTGYYTDGEWIWANSFRPVYLF